MKLVKTFAAVGAAVLLVPVAGMAQQAAQPTQAPQAEQRQRGPQGPGRMGGRGGARGAVAAPRQNPLLTEQQREQLRAFDEQQRTAVETARREIGDLHRQLEEELTAAQPNSGRVNQLRNSIVQKETALAQHRLDRLAKLSSVLTAEQRQQLRGRGLGSILRGGPGGAGGRGGFRGEIGPRRQPDVRGRVQMPRAPRGGFGRGGAVMAPRGLRSGGPGRADADLRAHIRRLEAELEALRRRIR